MRIIVAQRADFLVRTVFLQICLPASYAEAEEGTESAVNAKRVSLTAESPTPSQQPLQEQDDGRSRIDGSDQNALQRKIYANCALGTEQVNKALFFLRRYERAN